MFKIYIFTNLIYTYLEKNIYNKVINELFYYSYFLKNRAVTPSIVEQEKNYVIKIWNSRIKKGELN